MRVILYLFGITFSFLVPATISGFLEYHRGGDWKDVMFYVAIGWFCGFVYQVKFGDHNLRALKRRVKKLSSDLGYDD